MKAPIANLADFAALDPFTCIIDRCVGGLAGPGQDSTVDYVVTFPGYPRHTRPLYSMRLATGPARAAGQR